MKKSAPPSGGVARDGGHGVNAPLLGRVITTDGLYVVDERQRIVSWSSSVERVLGHSPEEVVGKACYLVLMGREAGGHPVCKRNCQVMKNARRGRGTAAFEVTAPTRDGGVKHLSNSVLLLEGEGRSFTVMHLVREIGRRPGAARGPAPTPPEDVGPVPPGRLTRRELEVLRIFATGSTNREIATRLGISAFTARNHVASVQRKLGARNRLEIVLLAMRAGLV